LSISKKQNIRKTAAEKAQPTSQPPYSASMPLKTDTLSSTDSKANLGDNIWNISSEEQDIYSTIEQAKNTSWQPRKSGVHTTVRPIQN
jgi:hypothetical protein